VVSGITLLIGSNGCPFEDEEIDETVIVVIQEASAKTTHYIADFTQSQFAGCFVEGAVSYCAKGICLLGKVGDKDILETIAVKIIGVDAHSSRTPPSGSSAQFASQCDSEKVPSPLLRKRKFGAASLA